MRVLLLSPLPDVDPACGDIVYTKQLLEHPPDGVQYEDYSSALRSGRIREIGRRSSVVAAPDWRGKVSALGLTGREHLINRARQSGILFREPFRHFEVQHDYDLVHCHVFSVRLTGPHPPMIVSNAAMLPDLYLGARNWSQQRTRWVARVDAAVAKATGVVHSSFGYPEQVIAFTERLRTRYISGGLDPARVHVVPIPMGASGYRRDRADPPRHIGFVATDFEAKGGPVVLRAFAQVRERLPDARLTVVGSTPRSDPRELQKSGITWIGHVPREELLADLIPSFDVFAYPTAFDGLPLVVLEALSAGVPVATSDYEALPEMIGHGRAGRVSPVGDSNALARNLVELLDPDTNGEMRAAAAEFFDRTYDIALVNRQLKSVYELAAR